MMILVPMSRQGLIDSSIQEVSDALGISFTRKVMPKEQEYDFTLRIEDLPSPHGFSIKILDEYLAWRIELAFDDFSAPLLQLMQDRFESRRDGIQSFIDLAQAKNDQIEFLINGNEILKNSSDIWKEVTLRLKKSYFSVESEFPALSSVLLDFMCLILHLLVKDVEWSEEDFVKGNPEGDVSIVTINRYERSRYNRALCLKFYGFQCKGCGDLLEEKYGPIGIGVIHVHHIVPISQMGNSYRLNPVKDLIPLCPNCHNIVHRKNPPIDISELRLITGYRE
jgi:5-methylcytosine-specific restriction enzyme A